MAKQIICNFQILTHLHGTMIQFLSKLDGKNGMNRWDSMKNATSFKRNGRLVYAKSILLDLEKTRCKETVYLIDDGVRCLFHHPEKR
ncbi:hypothetical protein GCK72_022761 [Caenorhabditis remanei]|uniref:Uncharacterized protein n=2 Tax=Caenorhabditis remanei TaxID=31234 RepID=A0A6A5FUK4_CAERE|nr:hypothetical protein GCK72_022761 [Caenorhabditis remanei]KAF1746308.1 hypothetical protein GCK72_022761 [Caenorhabditis remanei]